MSEYDIPDMSHRLLYQVTLSSGRIITRPEDFGDGANGSLSAYFHPIFAETAPYRERFTVQRLVVGLRPTKPTLSRHTKALEPEAHRPARPVLSSHRFPVPLST